MMKQIMRFAMCCAAVAASFAFGPICLSAEPTTSPTRGREAVNADDVSEEPQSADNYRSRADALWGVKHDYPKALATYKKGVQRFPKNVRIMVSLSATSIDFGYRHPDTDAGRAAYKEARTAIDRGLKLIADGDGEDVDDSAKAALMGMARQIP